ncbi:MAG TPA: carboxypeptidase-like regulatory domain-containing protein [Bacteroidales bacterium]|nr:carboxypeptidase-like regulatory domain-containing protein [Bacteroidales bacterium]
MKRLLIFCIAAFAGLQISFAQATITGNVSSKKDGKPISGAVIKVKDAANTSVKTDIKGNYSIKVSSDVTSIEVSAAGYSNATEVIAGKKTINFVMTPLLPKNSKKLVKAKGVKSNAPVMKDVKK